MKLLVLLFSFLTLSSFVQVPPSGSIMLFYTPGMHGEYYILHDDGHFEFKRNSCAYSLKATGHFVRTKKKFILTFSSSSKTTSNDLIKLIPVGKKLIFRKKGKDSKGRITYINNEEDKIFSLLRPKDLSQE